MSDGPNARIRAATVAMSMMVAAGGCGGELTVPENPTVDGVYSLSVVARAPLPAMLSSRPGYELMVIGGAVSFDSDSTYSRTTDYRTTENGASRVSVARDEGRLVWDGEVMLLKKPNGSTDRATLSGDRLELNTSAGVTWLYDR